MPIIALLFETDSRVRAFVLACEATHEGCAIVMTSHADTLQIAQCFVAGVDCPLSGSWQFEISPASVTHLARVVHQLLIATQLQIDFPAVTQDRACRSC